MKKNKRNILIGIVWIILSWVLIKPQTVSAECTVTGSGGPSSCSGAGCEDSCTTSGGGSYGMAYYNCGEYCFLYQLGECVSYGQACYWNTYTCTGSCGSGTAGGGGTGSCTGRTDNCVPGSSPAPNMLLPGVTPNPYCRRPTYCPALGTAQILTGGCCQTDYTDPSNPCIVPEVKSVQCCPSGTTEGYVDTVNSNYTYTHSCYDNAGLGHICQNPTDIWIADGRDTSSLCYVSENNCVEQNNGDIDCEYTNIYNFSTTCTRVTRTYSCVPTCSNVYPSSPYKTSPANGATVSTTTVNLTWNPPFNWGTSCSGGTKSYFIRVSTSPTLSSNNTDFSVGEGVTSQQFTGLTGTTYFWSVSAVYGTLDSNATNTIYSFTIQNNVVTGTVYLDSNNNCLSTTPWNGTAIPTTVRVDSGAGIPVNGSGVFSTTATPGAHNLAVAIPAGYICSTGTGCSSYACSRTITSPISNLPGARFYLTQNRAAWWQVMGGAIYAGSTGNGTTVGSTIPDSVAAGSRYLILPGVGGTAAAAMRASGDVPSVGSGTVNSGGWSAKTTYNGKKMDYTYFAKEMGLVPGTSDWLTSTLNEQAYNAAKDYWYSNQDSVITTSWDIANGESYTVFVDGDLTISANINVAPGGFLAFIVNGDITVSPTVQYIEGIYVAQNNFVTSSTMPGTTDIPLSVEGNVAAWGTVDLNRDLVGNNSNTPAEMFKYRSDIISSMPDKMKAFVMMWGEVVPGTYEE